MSDPNRDDLPVPERLRDLLGYAVEAGASDLHLIAGYPPVLRLHGDLVEMREGPLDGATLAELLTPIVPPNAWDQFQTRRNYDCSFGLLANGRFGRFRANLFYAGGHLAGCLRVVPTVIPQFDWLGFPAPLAERLAFQLDGLVIVTGATGSGKTTTLATLVNLLNQSGGYRIITVEEPVEYLFPREYNSVVTQREVGRDVPTFAEGLRSGLRQDPDVILVGEIRDLDTAQMALSAAETGHLVFTTLHTRDAKGAVSRFADFFPLEAQRDIRYQLASSLRGVVAQRLLPGARRGEKRHLALEVMWNTNPVASAVRNGKLESIDNCILTGRDEGMVSMDESVRQLLVQGRIAQATAEQNVRDVSMLSR